MDCKEEQIRADERTKIIERLVEACILKRVQIHQYNAGTNYDKHQVCYRIIKEIRND